MTVIRLSSSEGEIFEVDVAVAKMSITIKTMLEDLGHEDDEEIVRMPKISSKMMRLFVDWSTRHHTDPCVDPDYGWDNTRTTGEMDEWDAEFVKPLPAADLFQLVMAANYLNVAGLVDLASRAIANLLKGKSTAGMREVLNLIPRGEGQETFTEEYEVVPKPYFEVSSDED